LTPDCNEGDVVLTFLDKFRPTEYCTYHEAGGNYRSHIAMESLRSGVSAFDDRDVVSGLKMPSLDISQFPASAPAGRPAPAINSGSGPENNELLSDLTMPALDDFEMPSYNPLME
jgi:hypothetical protein